MAITLNLAGVETGFDPLEPGLYEGRIKSIEQKTSNAGKPYISMGIQLVENAEKKVGKNRQVFANFSLQENALWKIKQFLIRFGHSKEELEGAFDFEPGDWIGKDVVVALEPPDAGYTMNSVKDVYSPETVPA